MKVFDYKFKSTRLRDGCFIHPSFQSNKEFQRLEFLGDKVLALYLSNILILKFPEIDEGALTIALSNLVNQTALARRAQPLVAHFHFKGKLTNSTLSDLFEAWIGAVFLDGGDIHNILLFIFRKNLCSDLSLKDAKNILQETTQANNITPSYHYTYDEVKRQYYCAVKAGCQTAQGIGSSKKSASRNAAANLLKEL